MFLLGSRGDAVSMVIIAAIILISAAVLITQSQMLRSPTVPISTALSETKVSASKAMSLGLGKWAESGFSFYDPKWYNNGNFPPSLEEAKASEHSFVDKELDTFRKKLTSARGYTFEFSDPSGKPIIEIDSDNKDLASIDKNSITVRVHGITVVDESPGATAKQELDEEFKFDYSYWAFYERMLDWSNHDLNDISLNLNRIMESKPYQSRGCDCGYVVSSVSEDKIKEGYITWEEFDNNAVKPAVAALQAEFGPNVECGYTVDEKKIENIPNSVKLGSAGCDCTGGQLPDGTIAFPTEPTPLPTASWATIYAGGKEPYYGIIGINDENRADIIPDQNRGFPIVSDFTKVEGTLDPLDYQNDINCDLMSAAIIPAILMSERDLCKGGFICAGTKCTTADFEATSPPRVVVGTDGHHYALELGSHEVIGLTKRIAASVIVECRDKNKKVQTIDAFKDLTAKVTVRFALIKGARAPGTCLTDRQGCVYINGGSAVVPGGSECKKVDDPCQNTSGACDICKCVSGANVDLGLDAGLDAAACTVATGHLVCATQTKGVQDPATCGSFGPNVDPSCLIRRCGYKDIDSDSHIESVDICTLKPMETPCPDCRRCGTDGSCTEVNASKIGQSCLPEDSRSLSAKGRDQQCYNCDDTGHCIARENLDTTICKTNYGCETKCNAGGECIVPNQAQVGAYCPTVRAQYPDYECNKCRVSNNQLICAQGGSACTNGCCQEGGWGRCIGDNLLCCPAIRALATCPTPT